MSAALAISRDMPVIVQSADLASCSRWIDSMRRYGTNLVGCVSPAAGSDRFEELPLFERCADAVAATAAQACVSVMPPRTAADAVLEAAVAGIPLIVSLTVGVPVHDTMRVRRRIGDLGATWIGGGSIGLARPDARVLLGGLPADALSPGPVALVSTAGVLAAETALRLRSAETGLSLLVDVGGDMVKGTRMAALAEGLRDDAATQAIALVGTASGTEEDEFSLLYRHLEIEKPLFAYIAGAAHPEAAVTPDAAQPAPDAVARKAAALAEAGATVYNSLGGLVAALKTAA
jgi:succinyl-CoA synthetase alpha subunit